MAKRKETSLSGYLLRLATGSKLQITSAASEFRFVIIQGSVHYNSKDTHETKNLFSGSYFSSSEALVHNVAASSYTIIYIKSNETFKVVSETLINFYHCYFYEYHS